MQIILNAMIRTTIHVPDSLWQRLEYYRYLHRARKLSGRPLELYQLLEKTNTAQVLETIINNLEATPEPVKRPKGRPRKNS